MSLPFLQNYLGLSSGLQTRQASAGGAVGGWVELGRTTLGSANYNITVSSIPDKRYYMVLMNTLGTGAGTTNWLSRIGNGTIDSGSNYSRRRSQDGGADSTHVSINTFFEHFGGAQHDRFGYHYISNYATKEKLGIGNHVSATTAGAGNAPERHEIVNKWSNTSNVMDIFQLRDDGSDTYGIGSEVVVLGYDPADTHTTNFWTELDTASVASGSTLTSNVFTAKKYLWIQGYTKGSGDVRTSLRVGNASIDSGSNYSYRRSSNGSEDTLTSTERMSASSGATSNDSEFWNVFIVNNSANEKLAICHVVRQNTAGAGNAPNRTELVGKWVNTSNQINIVQFFNDQAGSYASGSTLRVWGSN